MDFDPRDHAYTLSRFRNADAHGSPSRTDRRNERSCTRGCAPSPSSRASEALRGLVDASVLTPDEQVELRGNPAAMLSATVQRKRLSEMTANGAAS